MEKNQTTPSPRRKFLGTLAAGAAAIGLSAFKSPLPIDEDKWPSSESGKPNPGNPDAWFNNIKGKHRIVYDVPGPKEGHEMITPFAWSKVFLLTNAATGTPEKDNSVVVVFRHNGIPFSMEDKIWKKYNFGEVFNIKDPSSGSPSLRNMMWKPDPPFEVPGIGPVPIGINDLQASGVMFCVCDMALTVFSAVVAQNMKMDKDEVKKEWLAGILPGIQVVPSGVWAVGRAQEHQCAYCFAG